MKLENILAKSNGETLVNHTNKVCDIIDIILNNNPKKDDVKDLILCAGKLHDIGKINKKIQIFFKDGESLEDLTEDRLKYSHNIIGWYFINTWLDHDKSTDIANLVLWHHSNYTNCDNLKDELSKICDCCESEFDLMKEFAKSKGFKIRKNEENIIDFKTSFNEVDKYLRSVLICADICASTNTDYNTLFNKESKNFDDINQEILNSIRTKEQLTIINDIKDNTTNLIKAPAGFGKTMIGLLWTYRRDKKLIWVCPTNTITIAVYENILKEIKLLNIEKISVELYYGGERHKSTDNNIPDFQSDIVVTNIDNFVKPSVSNSCGNRIMGIYNSDVIFDEVHELDGTDCALFSLYDNIMSSRHNKLDQTTLLLTATPSVMLFNQVGKQINILPNIKKHYKPIHNEKYDIEFIKVENFNINNYSEFVCFSNKVDTVQELYKSYNGNNKVISHGKFEEITKLEKKNIILDNYSKSNNNPNKLAIFTNQILTTACDYSLNTMIIFTPTIQSFYQAMGRVNRWGYYKGVSKIIIVLEENKNRKYIGNDYDNELQKLFIENFDKFVNGNKNNLTLNILYDFYNNFLNDTICIKNFNNSYKSRRKDSENNLKFIFPKKTNKKTNKKFANGNKLRRVCGINEIFISVENEKNNRIIVPYSYNMTYGRVNEFKEDVKTIKKQLAILKKQGMINNKQKEKLDSIKLFKRANDYDNPYIVFNYRYSDELGLYKI